MFQLLPHILSLRDADGACSLETGCFVFWHATLGCNNFCSIASNRFPFLELLPSGPLSFFLQVCNPIPLMRSVAFQACFIWRFQFSLCSFFSNISYQFWYKFPTSYLQFVGTLGHSDRILDIILHSSRNRGGGLHYIDSSGAHQTLLKKVLG